MVRLTIVTRLLLNANLRMSGNCGIIILDILWLPWICKIIIWMDNGWSESGIEGMEYVSVLNIKMPYGMHV